MLIVLGSFISTIDIKCVVELERDYELVKQPTYISSSIPRVRLESHVARCLIVIHEHAMVDEHGIQSESMLR